MRPPYFAPDDKPKDGWWPVVARAGSYIAVPDPNRFHTRDEARARAKELNEVAVVTG